MLLCPPNDIWGFLSFLSRLKAEGIFRINAENSQEERVRNQLNSGVVPHGIDVHCLAGLIKVNTSGIDKRNPGLKYVFVYFFKHVASGLFFRVF